jgi:hypothetical protein
VGAHRAHLKTNLVRVTGTGTGGGYLTVRTARGGSVKLEFPGYPIGGRLVIDYRINGVPWPGVVYPITSSDMTWRIAAGLRDQDKLEISNPRVEDASGVTVAVLGSDVAARGRDVVSSPLVWVVDTLSDVGFTRGGDTFLTRGGKWTTGFDALRSRSTGARLNNIGNRAEIEYSVNDGPWMVESVTFDVQSGKSRPNGRPGKQLPITRYDRVEVRRVDVFDAAGHMFATTGVRVGNLGHYVENVPTLVPTPSPTPTASPSPSPSPDPTPDPTASPDPTPDATPSPDPTPDPTPSPDPTPDATPSPDPTPDPTPSPDPTESQP